MREGIYAIDYQSNGGQGSGMMVMENGRVYGADPFGGKYDGDYTYESATGLAELRLKITFAPNAPAVFGVSHPFEWSIDVTTSIDPRLAAGRTKISTPFAPIDAQYRFLRPLPVG